MNTKMNKDVLTQLSWVVVFVSVFALLIILLILFIRRDNSTYVSTNTCLRWGLQHPQCTAVDFAEICTDLSPTNVNYSTCYQACITRGSTITENNRTECILESTCSSLQGTEPADIYFPRCNDCHWNKTSQSGCSLTRFDAYCDKWANSSSQVDERCQEACAADPLSMRCYNVLEYCTNHPCDPSKCEDGLDETPAEYYATRFERVHPCYSEFCTPLPEVQEICKSCQTDWMSCNWEIWCQESLENTTECNIQCTTGTWAACFSQQGQDYCDENNNCSIGQWPCDSCDLASKIRDSACYQLSFNVGTGESAKNFMVYKPNYPLPHPVYGIGVSPQVWRALLILNQEVPVTGVARVTSDMAGDSDVAVHTFWCFYLLPSSNKEAEPRYAIIPYDHTNMGLYFDVDKASIMGSVPATIRPMGHNYGVTGQCDRGFEFFIRHKTRAAGNHAFYIMPVHNVEPLMVLQANELTGDFYFQGPLFRDDDQTFPLNSEMGLGTSKEFPLIDGKTRLSSELGRGITFEFIESQVQDDLYWLWNVRAGTNWSSGEIPAVTFSRGLSKNPVKFINSNEATTASKRLNSVGFQNGVPSTTIDLNGFQLWLTQPIQPHSADDSGSYNRWISYKEDYQVGGLIKASHRGTAEGHKNPFIVVPFPFMQMFYFLAITENSTATGTNFMIGQANSLPFSYNGKAIEAFRWRSTTEQQLFPSLRSTDPTVFYGREAEFAALWACKKQIGTNPVP